MPTSKVAHERILVSVVAISYNHEKYVAEAIESFLAQIHDNFDIEIIIADDASTDTTQSIINNFQKKHSNIVAILNEKNVGIKRNLMNAMSKAKGKYIALCETDDYWTDNKKLQLQVSEMEKNPKAMVTFHRVKTITEDGSSADYVFPPLNEKDSFNLANLLDHNYIQTNSVMYRNLFDYNHVINGDVLPLDWFLHLYHAKEGKIIFIDKIMSVYRRHDGSAWWKVEQDPVGFWSRNAIKHLRLFENVENLFRDRENLVAVVHQSVGELIDRICNEVGEADNYAIATEIATTFPRYAAMAITQNVSQGSQPQVRLKKLNAIIKKLEEDNQALTSELNVRKTQLEAVLSSKSWKITEPMRKIHEKLKSEKRHS